MKRNRLASLVVAAALTVGLLSGAAQAAPIIYVGTSNGPGGGGRFGTLDLATDVFTPISNVPKGDSLAGLGFTPSGVLYGTGGDGFNNTVPAPVYQVNPTTGAISQIGTATLTSEASTTGSNGLVYAIDQNFTNGQLFTFNPANGTTTPIGSGIGFTSNGLAAFSPNGTFFTDEFNSGNDILARVDLNTGVGTLIGSGTGSAIFTGTFVNGTLYGLAFFGGNPAVFTINTTTGAGTFQGLITGQAPGEVFTAAAFPGPLGPPSPSAIPEPSTLACAMVGVLLAGAARLRRWRKSRA